MDDIERRLEKLEQFADDMNKQRKALTGKVAQLEDDVVKLQQRIYRLERSKMPIAEALKLYEMLKHDIDPELTLSAFAERYALNYDSLRKARARKQQKAPGVSGV
jgi:cell division septum initiation protein DivIVA